MEESELHSMYNNCIADYIMAFLSNNPIKIAPKLENNENNKVNLTNYSHCGENLIIAL